MTSLPRGNYTFRVQAANEAGIWNREGATLAVRQLPHYWETQWFRGGVALLLLAIVAWAMRIRTRRIELRSKELERIVAERTARLEEAKARTDAQAAQLRELDDVKNRFFTNISHEFRTPLTLILGPVQRALEGTYGPVKPGLHEDLGLIESSGKRLLSLVSQLLSLSKIDAGKMPLAVEPVDLRGALRAQVETFRSLAASRGIDLSLDEATARATPTLLLDRDKMDQVFSNLISNALKFTTAGGSVVVRVHHGHDSLRAGWVVIDFVDTGCGIAEEDQPRLFDRFYRAAGASETGTGVGLALVSELVALHHGRVSVASTPGSGSTFTVELRTGREHFAVEDLASEGSPQGPAESVAGEAHAPAAAVRAHVVHAQPPDAPRALVIDDHEGLRSFVASSLGEHFDVTEAKDGVEGLEKVNEETPDLVISDVMMPRMDGFDLCRAIRSDVATSHVPLILLTARADAADRLAGLELGADDYIPKPFDPKELLIRARNLVATRERLRRRYVHQGLVRPSEVSATPLDEAFLERVRQTIEDRIEDPELDVAALAKELAMSTRSLQRKLKALLGDSPRSLIERLRLERADQLLAQRAGTVAEVGYAVGFADPSTFSRAFTRRMGRPPSERAYASAANHAGK